MQLFLFFNFMIYLCCCNKMNVAKMMNVVECTRVCCINRCLFWTSTVLMNATNIIWCLQWSTEPNKKQNVWLYPFFHPSICLLVCPSVCCIVYPFVCLTDSMWEQHMHHHTYKCWGGSYDLLSSFLLLQFYSFI